MCDEPDVVVIFEVLWHIDDELDEILIPLDEIDEVDDEALIKLGEQPVYDNEIVDDVHLQIMLDEVDDEPIVPEIMHQTINVDENDEIEKQVVWVENVVIMLDEVDEVDVTVDELDDVDDDEVDDSRNEATQHITDDDEEVDEIDMLAEVDVNEYLYFVIQVIVDMI